MRAFVTGANGFIGSNICRRLTERGAEVRALVRAGSDKRLLKDVAVDVVEGDILDPRSLNRGVEGCDAVFHTAASVKFFAPDKKAMWRTNVEGTQNVLQAARVEQVKRFVHTSTVALLKTRSTEQSENGQQENYVVKGKEITGTYERSKLEAEKLVLAAVADGFPALICSPSGPVGPGDFKPSPVGKVIVQFLRGKIPAYTDTGLNVVDVRDVAEGHVLAAEKGRVGERYVLCGENLALADFFRVLSEVSGVPVPGIKLPYGVALTFGFFGEIFGRVTGREPLACLASVRTSKQPHYFVSNKAEKELGYVTRPVHSSLAEEVAWFRDNDFA